MSERTALYRFFGVDDVLLYVGITDHLGTRWHNHSRKKPWWPEVQRQTAEWHPSREAAAAAEIEAIQTEHPRHNVTYTVEVLTPEETARREHELARFHEVVERYEEAIRQRDASKAHFFDVCAQEARAGRDTADTLAARTAFTAVTIRKALRDRGVEALPRGPKSRKDATNG